MTTKPAINPFLVGLLHFIHSYIQFVVPYPSIRCMFTRQPEAEWFNEALNNEELYLFNSK